MNEDRPQNTPILVGDSCCGEDGGARYGELTGVQYWNGRILGEDGMIFINATREAVEAALVRIGSKESFGTAIMEKDRDRLKQELLAMHEEGWQPAQDLE